VPIQDRRQGNDHHRIAASLAIAPTTTGNYKMYLKPSCIRQRDWVGLYIGVVTAARATKL